MVIKRKSVGSSPLKENKKIYSKKPSRSIKKNHSSRLHGTHVSSFQEDKKKEEPLTRLNKYMAKSGVGSRREADTIIRKGFVKVNGKIVTTMGHQVSPGDVVEYKGGVLKPERLVYVLLNKPKGVITTTSDPKNRKTVIELIAEKWKERTYPVGRLDRNTTGLLLLTNDGLLANKLMHPSYRVKKIYKVTLNKALMENDFYRLQQGVELEEGVAEIDEIAVISTDRKIVGIELHIGWNRVIRRIFNTLDYTVVKLDRVLYAGLDKKNLPRGKWRTLEVKEINRLKHFC